MVLNKSTVSVSLISKICNLRIFGYKLGRDRLLDSWKSSKISYLWNSPNSNTKRWFNSKWRVICWNVIVKIKFFSQWQIGDSLKKVHKFSGKFWIHLQSLGLKVCREIFPVQTSHNSGITFTLRYCVVICACYVWSYKNFYNEIFLLEILFARHMKYSLPSDQATRIWTNLSLCIFGNTDNMEFCRFWVMVLILDPSSREEHELCSSDKRNLTSIILDVFQAMFTIHFSVTQI